MAEQKPKAKDDERKDEVTEQQNQGGADRHLQDTRSGVFGDNTSSSAGANNPGQHGRDGGEIGGVSNNPAPSDEAVSGEAADDEEKEA
jgi:hypothetical protein